MKRSILSLLLASTIILAGCSSNKTTPSTDQPPTSQPSTSDSSTPQPSNPQPNVPSQPNTSSDPNNPSQSNTNVAPNTLGQPNVNANKITEQQAKEIALKQVANSKIIEFSYDSDDAVPKYDVTLSDGTYEYEFEINAMDGSVSKMEKDSLKH